MKMVEVFKTNIQLEEQAATLVEKLSMQFPQIKVNFDLEDCDKVLRVEGKEFVPNKVVDLLRSNGYECRIMD